MATAAHQQCQAQECVLYGSVLDSQKDFLMQRLKGLCDPGIIEYYEQEMVFSLSIYIVFSESRYAIHYYFRDWNDARCYRSIAT